MPRLSDYLNLTKTCAHSSISITETSSVRALLFSDDSTAYFSSSAYYSFDTFPCSDNPIFAFSLRSLLFHFSDYQFTIYWCNSFSLLTSLTPFQTAAQATTLSPTAAQMSFSTTRRTMATIRLRVATMRIFSFTIPATMS